MHCGIVNARLYASAVQDIPNPFPFVGIRIQQHNRKNVVRAICLMVRERHNNPIQTVQQLKIPATHSCTLRQILR